nr:hypothetical protein [Tanacetum cinerariifolium]
AVIDELEKLRLPLTAAVDEELKNTIDEKVGRGDDVADSEKPKTEKPKKVEGGDDVSKEAAGDGDDVISGKIGEVVEDLLKDALRRCVGHARNWIAGSEERIDENSNVT